MVVEIFEPPVEIITGGGFKNEDILIFALITAAIEVPIFFLCGYRRAKDLIYFAAVNVVSNLLLNDFLQGVETDLPIIFAGEIFVVVLEFVLCSYWIKSARRKLLKVLILTNATSFFIGVINFWF